MIKAIEQEEPLKQKRVKQYVPGWFRKTFKEFAGVKGSQIHWGLQSGGLVYYRFVLQKKSNT